MGKAGNCDASFAEATTDVAPQRQLEDQNRGSAAVASATIAGGALRLVRASDGMVMLKPRLPFCTNTVPACGTGREVSLDKERQC